MTNCCKHSPWNIHWIIQCFPHIYFTRTNRRGILRAIIWPRSSPPVHWQLHALQRERERERERVVFCYYVPLVNADCEATPTAIPVPTPHRLGYTAILWQTDIVDSNSLCLCVCISMWEAFTVCCLCIKVSRWKKRIKSILPQITDVQGRDESCFVTFLRHRPQAQMLFKYILLSVVCLPQTIYMHIFFCNSYMS